MPIRGNCSQRIKITELRDMKASVQRAELSQAREESLCSKYPLTDLKDNPNIITKGKYNQRSPL